MSRFKSAIKKMLPKRVLDLVGRYKFHRNAARDAKIFLKKATKAKDPNTTVIVVGCSLGDMLYAMSLVEGYHRCHPEKKVVIFGVKRHEEIIKTFQGYDELYLVDENDPAIGYLIGLVNAPKIKEKALKENIITAIPAIYKKFHKEKDPQIFNLLRTRLYHIDPAAPPQLHKLEEGEISVDRSKLDKTVILNPYTTSIKYTKKQERIFCGIAKYLLERGYVVYTNLSFGQTPIEGTRALCCSLKEIYSICKHIPLVVSVRSGLLDFVIPTSVPMFVLYPEKRLIYRKFFTLTAWNGKGKLEELSLKEHRANEVCALLKEFETSVW